MRLCEFGQFLFAHLRNVGAGEVLDGLEHGVALPRTLEVDHVVANLHFGGAVQRERDTLHHLFHGVHHPVVVLIRHVQFHLGKLRVVETVHTLVTEVLRELIHAIETADDQLFQVELISNTQIERHVKGVVVGLERTSRRTAVQRLQNRGLHFKVALFVQIVTHRVDQQCALDERIFDMRVHDEVDVALTVTLLRILESVIDHTVLLFDDRQRAHRLAKDGKLLHVDADFACLRGEHETFHADNITDVQFLENAVIHRFVLAWTNVVTFGIDLDFAHGILQYVEGDGTHNALTHNTSGNAHLLEKAVVLREFLKDFSSGGVHLVGGSGVGIDAQIE